MYRNLIIFLFVGVAFAPWKTTKWGSSVTVIFPELQLTCSYARCDVNPPNVKIRGTERCIVRDTNSATVIVNRVYFSCQEFVGKTIIWQSGKEKLIGTVLNSKRTY